MKEQRREISRKILAVILMLCMVLQLPCAGFGVKAEDATATETQSDESQYTELTFSSYRIDNATYDGKTASGSAKNLTSMDKVAFSGKIKFGGNALSSDTYVRIGGINATKIGFALGIFYNNDSIYLFNHLDGGSSSLKQVSASSLTKNPLEEAVEIRLTFDYENETDMRVRFSIEGTEYYNGVIKDGIALIGTYLTVKSNAMPLTVTSSDMMADYTALTFTDLGYAQTQTVTNTQMSKSVADGTLHHVAIEGYYNFAKTASTNFVFIGGEKQGIRLAPTASGNLYVHYYNPSSAATELGAIMASAAGKLTETDVKIKVGFGFSSVDEETGTGNVKIIILISDTYQKEYDLTNVSLSSFKKTVRIVSGAANAPLTITSIKKVPMLGYQVMTFTDFGFEEVAAVSTSTRSEMIKSIEGKTLDKVAVEGYYNFAKTTAHFVYIGGDTQGLKLETTASGNMYVRYRTAAGNETTKDTLYASTLGINLTGEDVKFKIGFEFLNVNSEGTIGDVKVTMVIADSIERGFTINQAELASFHQTIKIKSGSVLPLTIKAIVQEIEYDEISFMDLGYDLSTTVESGEACKSVEEKSLDRVILQGYYKFSKVENLNVVIIGSEKRGVRLATTATGDMTLNYRDDENKGWTLLGTISATEELVLTEKFVKIATGFAFLSVDEVANTGTIKFTIAISDTYSKTYYLPNVSLDAFVQTVRIVSGADKAPLTIKDIATDGKDVRKLTFSDYGIKNGTYNGKGSLLYKKGALLGFEDLNCVEFSGKVVFGYNGTAPLNESVRIGGLTGSTHWNGIGVQYANTGIYLRNYLDGANTSLVHVPASKLKVNPLETAVEIKMLFVYVNDKKDVRLTFSIDGIKFYEDVIEDAVAKLGPYMVVSSQYTPMTVHSVNTGTEQETVNVEYYNLANVSTDDGYGYLVVGSGDILINGMNGSTITADNGTVLDMPGDYEIRVVGQGEYAKKVVLYLSGDAHPDGVWDIRDLVAIKKALCNVALETEAGVEGADIDRNGIVNASDYDSICNHLTGKTVIGGVKDTYVTYEKDVMPIAGYFGPYRVRDDVGTIQYDYLTDDIFSKIQSVGINLINRTQNNYVTSECRQDIIDGLALAEKYGIGVYVGDGRIGTEKNDKQLAGFLSAFANYSSFKGLSVVDEPDVLDVYGRNTNQINLGGYSKQAKQLNGYCNISGYINLLAMDEKLALKTGNLANDYDLYLETYIADCNPKVLSWDYYVFDEGIVNDTFATVEGYFTNLSVMRAKSMKYNIPFWSYAQAGTYWNEGGGKLAYKEINTPTKQQLLWNVNTALAYGAKGIQYFPLIQPYYFATDDSTDDGMDFTRNGLLGANGVPTQWYGYAQAANEQIREVDEVLLYATSKAVLVVGTTAQDKTGITLSSYGDLESVTADNGAIVGVFDYQGKTAYYVVNYDTSGTSTTGVSSTVQLNFNKAVKLNIISKQLEGNASTTDTTCTLELVSGGAALIIAD